MINGSCFEKKVLEEQQKKIRLSLNAPTQALSKIVKHTAVNKRLFNIAYLPSVSRTICVLNFDQKRNYAYKPKSQQRKEVDFTFTGDKDLEPVPMDMSKPRLDFEEAIKLIENEKGSDLVKKVLSLSYADTFQRRTYRHAKIVEKIRRHENDIGSLEEEFARLTIKIRANIAHFRRVRKDKRAKRFINGFVRKRRAVMEQLRATDRERYDWLRNEFQVAEIHENPYANAKWVHKRSLRINEARKKMFAVRDAKLQAVKEQLAAERQRFDVEKQQQLPQIIDQLQKLGVNTDTSIDKLLESVGMERVNMEMWSKRRRRLYVYNMLMEKTGRKRQLDQIWGRID